jgi:hypothetical protein
MAKSLTSEQAFLCLTGPLILSNRVVNVYKMIILLSTKPIFMVVVNK